MLKEIPPIDNAGLRQFGLLLSLFIALIFGVILPFYLEAQIFAIEYWGSACVLIMLVALGLPGLIRWIYIPWMAMSLFIGHIINTIILATVFYLLITPMGILMKIVGNDPMSRSLDKNALTYRKKSNTFNKNNFERPF